MSIIARLIEAGTPADLIEEVAMMVAEKRAAEKAIEEARAKARERQARKRDRDMSRDVTQYHVTDCDIENPGLSRPPNENNSNPPTHTPDGVNPRARKADPFPRPDWADPQVWADWMDVRKTKKARNTATAYAGFLTDIANLANDEWPPGRLLKHAVTQSWAGIYEPKQGYPTNDRKSSSNDEPRNPYVRAALGESSRPRVPF